MIVKMKKVTLLTDAKDQQSALLRLRQVGVLHPHIVERPSSDEIQQTESMIEKLDKALSLLTLESKPESKSVKKDADTVVATILEMAEQKEHLTAEMEKLLEKQRWFERWGKVSFATLQELAAAQVFCRFYQASKNEFEAIEDKSMIQVIHAGQNLVSFIQISRVPDEQLDFRQDPIPEIEYKKLLAELAELEKSIDGIDQRLGDLSAAQEVLLARRQELQKTLQFNTVAASMTGIENIAFLQGYCPEESISAIEKLAAEQGLGFVVEDPDRPEEVPTLLRNPRWVRIIQPLFSFMGTLPGYAELDVSFIFLAFFSLFFAMLVGDAGYGLIFLAATFWLSRKKKTAPREFFRLMYLLSFGTIVWGVLSGNYFGSEQLSQLPFLRSLVIEGIYSFSDVNQDTVMRLTFIIGTLHLSVGHLLAAFKKINSLTALAELGWIAVLWAVFFVANNLILGKEIPQMTTVLFILGAALIGIFANFQKNIFKGILTSVANLPLSVINSFSDIVSYIRLFAVGMSTVIVASNFNQMASGSGESSIIGTILSVLILLLGHSLNITLAMMSVLVHGVRLNMLEFSSHVGMQWTGKKYEPFKE